MTTITESQLISGVYIAKLKTFSDQRGQFVETFRKEWFPQRSWAIFQTNRVDSTKGVLRGLHYHHNQVDYWYVSQGIIRVGLADIRPSSPTYMQTQTIEMGGENNIGLFIPCGVAHGYTTLTAVTHNYIVDSYYNGGADENGVAWNDPELKVDWGVANPILSERDAANPRLRDIAPENLPQ
ncbi:MAG: dTDP-4-dehydrorhamnose 3,5-epimerase [Chloroflexi bacterium]|nr:MAG: dTDP-4-dehydrorhamnose 3,5-epimerase [Chloroflexota bacterium]PIE80863.1 MAG: dTDP-4-dehydrorhamnose 3,5-epimerase [Chloroflexota bacterium]